MIIEDLSIKYFMDAWFKQKYDNLSKDDFEIAYIEYVDVSGMFVSRQFDLLAYIYNLDNKINCINFAVKTQKEFLNTFGEPYLPELDFLKPHGFSLLWHNDKERFHKDLNKILSKTKRYELELKQKRKEWDDLQDKDKGETKSLIQTRHDFINMLNVFNKNGFSIDKEKTTVEELALMIKQNRENASESTRYRN